MKTLNWKKRSIIIVLAIALMLSSALMQGAATQTEEELQAQMSRIEGRIATQREEITRLRARQASQEELLPALDEEIQALEARVEIINTELVSINATIEQLNERIADLNENIAQRAQEIDALHEEAETRNAQIGDMQQRLMDRLRQQYMNGPVSNLQLILSSPDLSSLLTVSELIVRQADEDARLRLGLEDEMVHLRRLQEALEYQQEVYAAQRAEAAQAVQQELEARRQQQREQDRLNTEHTSIMEARAAIHDIIEGLRRDSAAARRIIEREQQAYADAQRQVNAIVNQRINSGQLTAVQNDGDMVWPFPHHGCFITSRFGASEPFRGGRVHRGVDISIANNWRTDWSVVAALCGVIADFGFNSSMGNFVVIYHGYFAPAGGRIQTVYMHFHSFAPGLRRNMAVSAGQHIGMMGNTGHSTGPHLHFQVDLFNASGGRTAIDPMRFVTGAPYLRAR